MTAFNHYARYYDLLYRDKDYAGEARFVTDVLTRHGLTGEPPTSLIELGCGTGRHAALFAEGGTSVLGVDASEGMVEEARRRLATLPESHAERLRFAHGDIRDFRANSAPAGGFDAAASLFHVFSYQTGNDDLHATLETACHHLRSGGILLFDCWYGPAVLTDRPATRIKRLEDDTARVVRLAEPEWHPNANRVDVHYQVLITDKTSGRTVELNETHAMRYLFLPEIELLLHDHGMTLLEQGEWMTQRPLGAESWNAYFVARSDPDA